MSLDLETRLRTFFASAPQTIHPIQTLQISHSAMSRVWSIWREPYVGTVGGVVMTPVNFEVKLAGSPGHLDQKFDIRLDLTDVENAFRTELDLIPIETTEKIAVVYREYLSDDLDNAQASATLQIESISYAKGAASLSAVSPRLNIQTTGEKYVPSQIPMLRGFL